MEYNCSCRNCKADLYRKPSYLQRYKMVFCDRECRTKFNRSQHVKLKLACSFCSKEIEKTQAQKRASKTGLSFCNNECKNTYIARNSRWSGNPFDYRGRKDKIFEAAKSSCQKCGYNEDVRMLDVHHHDEDHQNNCWTNFRCVCVWCHQEYHRCGVELDLPTLFDREGSIVNAIHEAS